MGPISNLAFVLSLSANLACFAQNQTLDLKDAIQIALQRNGLVNAARLDLLGAKARLMQTKAQFFPSISQGYEYIDTVSQGFGSPGSFEGVTSRQTPADLAVRWIIIDSGQRKTSFLRADSAYAAARYDELAQRRTVVFETTSHFYEALKGQELVRVAEAQVERARRVLEITKARVEEGDLPAIEVLQAEADLANAEVSLIQARIAAATAQANLKATLGWPEEQPLPTLRAPAPPSPPARIPEIDYFQKTALEARPELRAQEHNLRALTFAKRQAELDQRISFELSASYFRRWQTETGDNRRLYLVASIPIFDAGLRREIIREAGANEEAAKYRLLQQQRTIRANVEASYLEFRLRSQALLAAETALRAARANYQAAEEARRLGATGLAELINAQVALVTAETNAVQAVYDYYVAETKLAFVSGLPLPGDT